MSVYLHITTTEVWTHTYMKVRFKKGVKNIVIMGFNVSKEPTGSHLSAAYYIPILCDLLTKKKEDPWIIWCHEYKILKNAHTAENVLKC